MDVGMGIIASTLANVHRKSGAKPFTLTDFAPYLRAQEAAARPEPEASPAQFISGLHQGNHHG
jgi:hypothetical protein